MRAVLMILKKSWLQTIRRPSTILFMIALPLLFTFVFGVAPNLVSNRLHIAVVDEDQTPISAGYIRTLSGSSAYAITQIPLSQRQTLLREQQVSYVLVIPRGTSQRALRGQPIELDITPSVNQAGSEGYDVENVSDIRSFIVRVTLAGHAAEVRDQSRHRLSKMEQMRAFVHGMDTAKALTLTSDVKEQFINLGGVPGNLTASEQAVIGFATMFIIFAVFARTGDLFVEKQTGTWDRLTSSGAPRRVILAGYGGAMFLVGWAQFAVLYLSGWLLFNIRIPFNGWMAVAVSLYILAVCGIALCVSHLVTSQQQQGSIGTFIAIVTSMIGGAYWPLDIEPTWMQHFAWFMPQNWAMDAFRILVAHGSVHQLLWPLSALAAFAIVFFGAGLAQLRYS